MLLNMTGIYLLCCEVNLTLKLRKLKFKWKSVPFFGNVVTDEGIEPDLARVDAIKDCPVPNCLGELQSFQGASLVHLYLNCQNCIFLYRVYVKRMLTSCGLKCIKKLSKPLKMLFFKKHYCHTIVKGKIYLSFVC